jgi:RHS repeat-associated protein
VNHYYPYGGLFGESTNDEVQRYKYNGKELDRMHGLNLYDYGARQYDAALGQFTTMDPLCEKYYHISPYAYCMGNPVKLIDSDGKRPKAYEAALMAAYVYGGNVKHYRDLLRQASWEVSSFPTSIQTNYTKFYQNGLQSVLFERTKNGVTEYAYVYAGTNSAEDWVEDFIQIAGIAPQYHTAIKNARTLSNELENNELTFVGHSLGGGEAIASSMATGRAAITFNPAAVSLLTKYTEGLEKKPDVVNYRAIGEKIGIGNIRIGGDVLNNLQEKVGLSLPGRTIGIPTGLKPTHSIDEFLHSNILDPL